MPFSMTGFGAAEGPVAGGHLRVEIRTVNHRFFNPAFKLPSDLAALELELRERLRREFERGHVAVSMRWVNGGPSSGALQLNVERAREAMARLRELQTAVGISGEISLDLLARQMDVLTVSNGEPATISWEEVEPIVGHAATACRAMRRREGDALATELRQRLSELARLTREIDGRAPERLVQERDRLRASVAEILDGRVVDELRLHQELAFLAEKLDITEELVRLKAHFGAVEQALGGAGGVGKQLGFLVQEMGREINTIGSKAGDAAIAQAVIAMKGELEKFREQVENLE
jgi:uncharacterized protein (TIGR00255 family)